MFIHANFWSVGSPSTEETAINPVSGWSRAFFEATGIIAVNCFVFISGWFGIHFKIKGLVNFLFQCVFFYVGTTVILVLTGVCDLTEIVVKRMVFLENWYILSYFLLLIMSPVLNAFVDNVSRKEYRLFLLLFWGFALTYGYFSSASTFNGGYSPVFFFGLYLLVRYIRIYSPKFATLPIYADLLIYLTCTVLITVMFCCLGISCYTYLNPLVIVSAIHFSLIFTKFELKSKVVNWFAASAFAAYLLHTSPCIADGFRQFFKDLWAANTVALFWIKTIAIIVAIMGVAVILDQLRIIIYKWSLAKVDFGKVCDKCLSSFDSNKNANRNNYTAVDD